MADNVTHMWLDEVFRPFWSAMGGEIGWTAADDAPDRADARCDKGAVGQLADPHGNVDLVVDEIERCGPTGSFEH